MKVLSALAIALALVICADPAGAFKRSKVPNTNVCLYWPQRTLTWHPAAPLGFQPEDAGLDALRASFDTWSQPSCTDLSFVEGDRANHAVGFDSKGTNENVVLFRTGKSCDDFGTDPCAQDGTCVEKHDCWDYGTDLLAVTTTSFDKCGQILDADIELNGGLFPFTTGDGPTCASTPNGQCVAYDIQNTATHEIGHFIGFDHPASTFDGSDVRDDTMFASAARGEIKKRTLAGDDVEGLCTIYPAGEPPSACMSAASCATKSASNSGGGCQSASGTSAAATLLGLAALASRRRNRTARR